MTPEEPNSTAEQIDLTTEAIVEAIRTGHLVEATRALWMVFNARSASREFFDPGELLAFHPEAEWTMRTDLPRLATSPSTPRRRTSCSPSSAPATSAPR